ncbi:MAG: transcriptional repressor [Cognatishimia sp.]|nr:transcriptional repressor [Cognatishimia sp.]
MPSHEFQSHDHSHCVSDAMNAALLHCEKNSLKFTPVRQRVFEILLSEHKAMGAYDILEILAKEGMGSQPPVVYRALDFLGTHGFVHKIEKLNAFVACEHPGSDHDPAFMICRSCTKVVEMEGSPNSEISTAAKSMGFEVEAIVVEAEGLCPTCQDTE